MSKDQDQALATYYREAGSWTEDKLANARRAQKRAWLIVAVLAVVAVFEAIALIALTPLKTVVPYTLLVDRQTGFVQSLAPLDAQKIAPDTALTQSFLVQYVLARESYDGATVQADYRKTALWSADTARSDYLGVMQGTNPASPLNLYPRTTTIGAFVKSVSPLEKDRALVRFATYRRDADGQPRYLGSWVAVIRYRFSDAPMSGEDRFLNPLGFQVISYRRNQEALPQVEATSTPAVEQQPAQPVAIVAPPSIAPPVGATAAGMAPAGVAAPQRALPSAAVPSRDNSPMRRPQ